MSGPIIRKYGFPNFEQIFGKESPKHGVDDEGSKPDPPSSAAKPDPPKAAEGSKPSAP